MASFQADYQMKRIALGQVPSGVPELQTYAQRTKQVWDEGKATRWSILSDRKSVV